MSDESQNMRTFDEVQRAHDMLVGIILGHIENPFIDRSSESLQAAADVLCWILKHNHNETFAQNLLHIEDYCATNGIAITRG